MDNFEILKTFDKLVDEKFNLKLKEEVDFIKSSLGLDNSDLEFFVGRKFSDDDDYMTDSFTTIELSRLYELRMPSEQTKELVKEYNKNKHNTLDEKVTLLLSLFDIKDEDSLDRLINTIADVRSSIYEVDKENGDIKLKGHHPSHRQYRRKNRKECRCEKSCSDHKKECEKDNQDAKGYAEMSYSYYDSEKMKEPKSETFSFDFDPTNYMAYSKKFKRMADKILKLTKE